MRSFGPLNKASNALAMTFENHRLKKSQEVDLFIQRLARIRFKTSLSCYCFVLTGLSKQLLLLKSQVRGGQEGGAGKRMLSHV